ncbi:MFS transporter [Komagataeibacter xylinus]|uniref:MFS transporter n=1 Tax=Komagataeibacter xylinus TaxID=28448 RepID=UPI00280BDB16|nr:MFS transporter [Komagataeibacter xylinus]
MASQREVGSVAQRKKILVLTTASLVCSMIMLDSNIVAVSLPAIARSLHASFTDIEWVVSAYVLTFAALLMAAGSYADRHGRKLAVLIGLAVFAVASGLCGLATSAIMLNLARALQGVGASLLLTAALAVINHTFDGSERARAYAFWGSCIGIAITSGPIIGGIITNLAGWRWAFLINLPICAILIAVSFYILSESSDHEAKRLDFAGIVTFSTGLFLLIWALIDGNTAGWASRSIMCRFVGAVVLLAAFIFVELRQERPMVDFALFTQRDFLGSVFAMLGYAGGAQVMIFFLPMFLQNAYGYEPAAAGLAMVPFALPMFLTPRFGGRLANRHSVRSLLAIGLITTFVGDILLYEFARAGVKYLVFAAGMLVVGAGAGLLNSETTKAMQGAVPAQRGGMASGLTSTVRFVGLLLGVAGLGAVLSKAVSREFTAAATVQSLDPRLATAAAKRVASGDLSGFIGAVPPGLQSGVHRAAQAAFAGGFATVSLVAAAVAAASCILTLILTRTKNVVVSPANGVR